MMGLAERALLGSDICGSGSPCGGFVGLFHVVSDPLSLQTASSLSFSGKIARLL